MNIFKIAILYLALLVSGTNAQVPDGLCTCSPTVFRFTLDFEGVCPGSLEDGNGIDDLSCDIFVLQLDQSNPQPTLVDAVTILELNMDDVINSTTIQGPFDNGDVIEYTSISSLANLTEIFFPYSLQMTLTGGNSDGNTVVNVVSIDYDTSECEVYPLFPSGSTIGWVDIVSCLGSVV